MKIYHDLVRSVLLDESGSPRKPVRSRGGHQTISKFNLNYEVDLSKGFPLLTTKKMSWKNIVIETLWYLSANTTNGFLTKHGVRIWDSWTDEFGEVECPYGFYWRRLNGESGDQVASVIRELKENPYSRRLVVSAWDPVIHAGCSHLPPCHVMWILNVDFENSLSRLNLHLTQRSGDMAIGVPYNIACYSLLLHLISRFSNIEPGKFAHSIVNAHVYSGLVNHVEGLNIQMRRDPLPLPSLLISPNIRSIDDVERLIERGSTSEIMDSFKLRNYAYHPPISFEVAV